MTAPQALLPVPRPKVTEQYDRRVTEQSFQAIERDLQQKYDRRGDLILDPGAELVLTADNSSAQYGIGIDNSGYLRVLDYSDGTIGTFSVAWAQVDGASQEITNLTSYVDTQDASLQGQITVNASTISTQAGTISAIETELTAARDGEVDLLAQINSLQLVGSNNAGSIATLNTNLSAQIKGGPNLIPYARFDDVDAAGNSSIDPKGWDGRANNGGMSGASVGVTGSSVGASNQPPGLRCIRFFQPASQTTGYSDAIYDGANDDYEDIPCIPGQRYCASVFANAQNGTTIDVRLNFRDSSGTFISDGDNDDVTNGTASANLGVGTDLSYFERIWAFADAPSNAAFVSMQIFKYPDSGGGQSFGFATLPMIEQADASQENPSPWTDAPRNAEVSINASAIADIEGNLSASYGVTVDANGRIASMVLLADGTTSAIKFRSDTFTIYDGSSSDVAPFSVSGGVVSMTNVEINGSLVVNGTVDTDQLASNSVTNTEIDQTAAATSPTNVTWTDVASFSFTSVGIGVQLRGSCDVNIFSDGTSPLAQFRLVRDSTTLKTSQAFSAVDAGSGFQKVEQSIVLDYNDLPSSGTYVYKLQAYLNEGTSAVVVSTFDVSNRFLSATEFKR